jgi:hypothetical protein
MSSNKITLLAIFLLGLALRCINLVGRGIQYDDAFSYFLASQNLNAIVMGTAADTMPPLYYFALHFLDAGQPAAVVLKAAECFPVDRLHRDGLSDHQPADG